MPSATLTSKGQMTLPKSIRDRFGLKPGDRLDVYEDDGRIVLVPKTLHIADLCGVLPTPARAMSIEEMNEAIAEAASGQ